MHTMNFRIELLDVLLLQRPQNGITSLQKGEIIAQFLTFMDSYIKFGAKHEVCSLDRIGRSRHFSSFHILVRVELVEQGRRLRKGRNTFLFFHLCVR